MVQRRAAARDGDVVNELLAGIAEDVRANSTI
jgi:hypothetical protein